MRLRFPLLIVMILAALLPSHAIAAPDAPVIVNWRFECTDGYDAQTGITGRVPRGWTAVYLSGMPMIDSTRIHFAGSCDGSGFIERLEGIDSLTFLSQDMEKLPEPGKPFDAAVYQQVRVTAGVDYSLSAWMVSLCGGSATPSDCPSGYYMSKMLGIDPAGGTDPLASSVVWVEDRRNFTESRWANLRLAATAQSDTITIFARIRSPYRWHGAHAFVDAISLMAAPTASIPGYPAGTPILLSGYDAPLTWTGSLGSDIPTITGGNYELLFDLQSRAAGESAWTDWLLDQDAGAATFDAGGCAGPSQVYLRIRARAEQPEDKPRASPNQRYPGVWSEIGPLVFGVGSGPCEPRAWLPAIR